MELKIPKGLQKKKEARPSGKGLQASKGAKFVLLLGDEGAILIYIKGHVVQSRQFVPDASQQNLQEFQQSLSKDLTAPLMLVVDSMDQSYMQQTLPPVSSLSVNKLIKRRLDRDFAKNEIKGAILLGREKTGRKDWNFLMIALEKSPQFTVWLNFVKDLPHRFLGIYLASVESEVLLNSLEYSMGIPKGNGDKDWKFFVSHNKVGGFRQVILKGGRIIFTRLTQPVGDSNAEVVAGSIEQEMLSTIEYMKRLSFGQNDRLDVYIITSSTIKEAIDANKFHCTSFHILTPYEVMQHLGIEGAAQPTDQFGDVVLAATIGCSKKHVLTLTTPQNRLVSKYYHLLMFQRTAATAAILGILGYGAVVGYDIISLLQQNSKLTDQTRAQQHILDNLREDVKRSKLDVEKASDLIDLYQQLGREKLSPLPMIKKLEPLMQSPVWIKAFDWELTTATGLKLPPATAAAPNNAPVNIQNAAIPMITTIMLEFPQEAAEPKMFKALSKKLLADFKKQFKGFDVRYLNMPEEKEEIASFEIRSTVNPQANAPRPLDVQLTIKGDMALLLTPLEESKPPVVTDAPVIDQPPQKPKAKNGSAP